MLKIIEMDNAIILIVIAGILILFFSGVRIIRPTHRGLVERFGKYNRFSRCTRLTLQKK
jgi:regulator of protease activity HflC (stomatin/prohibitin superfamily)